MAMKISDELIACYIDGTATAEERNTVRKYLCEHPEEYEQILYLMDKDKDDYLGEQLDGSCIANSKNPFFDIAYSAAAFAPEQNNLFTPKKKSNSSRIDGLYDRISSMFDELDNI